MKVATPLRLASDIIYIFKKQMFWGGWEKTAPAKLGKVTHVPIENESPLPIGWAPGPQIEPAQ